MIVGYARVSTQEQNLDRQIESLKAYGCEEIFTEKVSGKTTKGRRIFQDCLAFLRKKDTLVVASLDRLGRNYDNITNVVRDLSTRQINLVVLDMPFLNAEIQDESMARLFKDMVINLLSYVAENERKKMLERQKQGIAVAKSKGVYKGKPLEYSATAKDHKKRVLYFGIVQDLNAGEPIMSIVKKYGVSRNLVYRIRRELKNEEH